MSPNGKPATYANTCRLRKPDGQPCNHRIENVPLAVPIIGQQPEDRALRVAEAMGRHVWKAHTQFASSIEQGAKVYQAFLIGQTFTIEDPNAQRLLMQFRREILTPIPRPNISDENLLKIVEALELGSGSTAKVLSAMQTLRNILTETQPAPPVTSPLVSV